MLVFPRRWDWRLIAAYSAAFVVYTICTGWIIPVYEKFVCDLMVGQVLWLRLLSGMPRLALGFLCGMMERAIESRIGDRWSDFLRRAAAGTLSLFTFQLVPYAATALFMGVGARQAVVTIAIYIVIDIGCGWWYASLLERMRRRFCIDARQSA